MGKKLLKTHKVDFSEDLLESKWYIVVTMFNHERKVADMLEKRFESMGAADKLKEIFVPIQEWEEIVEGKIKKDGTRAKRTVKKSVNLLESGYIFINLTLTNHVWNIVRQTTGVAGWLNMDGRPSEVPAEDVAKFKILMGDEEVFVQSFEGKIGDKVKIIDGPFKDYLGKIANIDNLNVSIEVEELNGARMEINALQLEVI